MLHSEMKPLGVTVSSNITHQAMSDTQIDPFESLEIGSLTFCWQDLVDLVSFLEF